LHPAYLRTLSAARLAALIRDRRVTAREVTDAHLAHARAINPRLNAIVADRYQQARIEAHQADEQLASGVEPGPLHGVPCTIKECFALTGMPHSSGLVARRDVYAIQDATGAARLRAAGAIPLGVTNVSELCMWMETNNNVYGRTHNPYDLERIVGGSSGGEGAIVGSGASPFGLGSDVGGSIRMPAFFNGVFGHKPSGGLVPNTGQHPIPTSPQALRYLCTGPLARRAEDLPLLLSILAGPDGEDVGCREMRFDPADVARVRISELRVLQVEDDGFTPVSRSLRRAQRDAAARLAALGADVIPTRIEALKQGLGIWSALLSEANDTPFLEHMREGRDLRLAPELLRWALGRSPHTFPALGLAVMETLGELVPRQLDQMKAAGVALREELHELLGEDGVMLYPSYAETAPRHVQPMLVPIRWVYTALLNVMEVPATQVPLGLDERGLPLGVQVAARPGNDHLTLAVAQTLERALGGWIAPRL